MKNTCKEIEVISDTLKTKIKYIAKPDEWFDAGTEVKLIDDYRDNDAMFYNKSLNAGLFEGLKDGQIDQEVCCFDEFIFVKTENFHEHIEDEL